MDTSSDFVSRVKQTGTRIIEENHLLQPNNRAALLLIFDANTNWALLLTTISIFPTGIAIPLGWILAIRLLNCMAQISHGCGHQSFVTRSKWNNRIGHLMSALMGYGFWGHNLVHEAHHRYLNTTKDEDAIWSRPNQTRKEFLLSLTLDLIGYHAFCRLVQYTNHRRGANEAPMDSWILISGTQLTLITIFSWASDPWAYAIYYVIPICSLYPAQTRIRSLAEHYILLAGTTRFPLPWVVRNTEPGFIERQIIGPYFQNYHIEHHIFPKLPAYYLKDLHEKIVREIYFDDQTTNRSYLGFTFQFLMGRT